MNNLPKIIMRENKDEELALFIKFFNHPFYRRHREYIIHSFPEIENLIKNSKNEENAFRELIDNFYERHSEKINIIVGECKKEIEEKSEAMLSALSKMMDYKWLDTTKYIVFPTILPFSPFNGNVFYLSILEQIKKGGKPEALIVAAHEISHFIFFDYLDGLQKNGHMFVPDIVRYFLQESLAAALINTDPLKSVLGVEYDPGNPELHETFVQNSNEIIKLADWVRKEYIKCSQNKIHFNEFIRHMTDKFISASDKFEGKKLLWDKYGYRIFKDERILKKYQEPIQF